MAGSGDNERQEYELAVKLWQRFCTDLVHNSAMARVRMISAIQLILASGREGYNLEEIVERLGVKNDG